MPRSNPLAFLRPLYDIAVWQFLLMSGYVRGEHMTFTWKIHKVIANFVCKLVEMPAFQHIQEQLQEDAAKEATGGWSAGDRATKKIVDWCQDQWRRKKFSVPENGKTAYTAAASTMPWFEDLPLCHKCGTPCPECRNELGTEVPDGMPTLYAVAHHISDARSAEQENNTIDHVPTPVSKRLRTRK